MKRTDPSAARVTPCREAPRFAFAITTAFTVVPLLDVRGRAMVYFVAGPSQRACFADTAGVLDGRSGPRASEPLSEVAPPSKVALRPKSPLFKSPKSRLCDARDACRRRHARSSWYVTCDPRSREMILIFSIANRR